MSLLPFHRRPSLPFGRRTSAAPRTQSVRPALGRAATVFHVIRTEGQGRQPLNLHGDPYQPKPLSSRSDLSIEADRKEGKGAA